MLNQNQWNKMHAENRFRPKYPEDDVVRWLFSNMSSILSSMVKISIAYPLSTKNIRLALPYFLVS